MAVPLILSAFTHLWNVVGFPSIHVDEGYYLRRAMLVLQGKGPQESINDGHLHPYDHPYFGQIFLASLLKIVGYPSSVIASNPSSSSTHAEIIQSIQMLYLVPRVLMGILAVVDTFLIYKISELRYDRKVAFIASVLFGVMPLLWMLRRVYLDTILTPFLLSSILCALYYQRPKTTNLSLKSYVPLILSGVFLGLAIFTKIPAIAIIPLVGFIIVCHNSNNNNNNNHENKNLKVLGLWFIPVVLIPLIWLGYSVSNGQFDLWLKDVMWQAHRHNAVLASVIALFQVDLVFLILGLAGTVFAAIRKDWFSVIWVGSFVIFFAAIGWVQYFHWIPVFPAFCIAAARMIEHISNKIDKIKDQKILPQSYSWPYLIIITAIIGIFGLASTIMLITTNVNASYFNIDSQIVQHISDNSKVTIIGSHWWIWNNLWVSQYIFHKNFDFIDPHFDPFFKKPVESQNVMFIVDRIFVHDTLLRNPFIITKTNFDSTNHIERLSILYRNTYPVAYFIDSALVSAGQRYNPYQYPYTSMQVMVENENRGQGLVQIRTNYH
ncbi:MAG TPA: phospholipid carrier-dependent glycosyltransferase [Nitrososphaeraceae archaeon]